MRYSDRSYLLPYLPYFQSSGILLYPSSVLETNHPNNSLPISMNPSDDTTQNEDNSAGSRPLQGVFTDDQVTFLESFLPTFTALDDKKGVKKKWVLKEPYPAYIAKFNSAGPDGVNLQSLQVARNFLAFCHDRYLRLTACTENISLVHKPCKGG
jgi:hypothetical protein